jgi:hypothetical protein
MTHTDILEPRALARIAGAAAVVTGAIALLAAITIAAQARRWLGFTFAGVPARIGEAGSILFNNGRFVVGIGAAAWVLQLRLRKTSPDEPGAVNIALSLLSWGVDGVVLLAALVNAALVGLALGAYGWRTVEALLPHGPFEICAYCIAGNLYLNARRRLISRDEWITVGATSIGLLIVAAVLETFAWVG